MNGIYTNPNLDRLDRFCNGFIRGSMSTGLNPVPKLQLRERQDKAVGGEHFLIISLLHVELSLESSGMGLLLCPLTMCHNYVLCNDTSAQECAGNFCYTMKGSEKAYSA